MTKSLRKAIMMRPELENKYLKNRTIEKKVKYKKQENFCSKLYKNERKNFFLKRFWKTVKPLLNDKCIHSSAIALVNIKNVISYDFNLAKLSIITLKVR